MMESKHEVVSNRLDDLKGALGDIRRNMESLVAENHRLREVVRLAESELRNRRDQVQRIETDLQSSDDSRLEIQARITNAMEKIDSLLALEGQG